MIKKLGKIGTQMLKTNKQPATEKCWLKVFMVNYSAVLGKHWKTEGGLVKGGKKIHPSALGMDERDD